MPENLFYSGDFYPHCVEKQAWLVKGDDQNLDWIDLSNLPGCPDLISYNGITYSYSGISNGRAFYNVVESQEPSNV